MSNKTEVVAALESAISAKECAVGAWSVNFGDGYAQLVWSCDESDTPEMYGDEPWSQWGGNEIIASAGIGDPDDSGCDSYVDRYGDAVVAQWAQWNVE